MMLFYENDYSAITAQNLLFDMYLISCTILYVSNVNYTQISIWRRFKPKIHSLAMQLPGLETLL